MALTLVLTGPAFAQCAPEPTQANGTTTCTGTDTNGIRVTTPETTVTVASGATVANTGASPITVEVPNTVPSIDATIVAAGQVTSAAQSGITLLSGPVAAYNGSMTRLALTVANGGSVSGSTALTMARTAGNQYGQLVATVDNAGLISGSSGIALRGDVATTVNGFTTGFSGFASVANRAGASILGSVVGPLAVLTNAGLIDGGSGSALTTGDAGTSIPYFISPGVWTNSGTIRSTSGEATILSSTIGTLTNSGIITNTGSGLALSSSALTVQNLAGGVIASGGANAINGTGYVNLVNRGTITGNVVTGNTSSLIDSSLGRINGSVAFGSGNDTLVVRYGGTATLVTGISGTINAGGGTNTEQLAVGSDTTIATAVTLLSGFQQFAIATDKGVTTTLGAGFVAPTTIQLVGAGTLVNRAAIITSATAFALNGVSSPESQQFVNEGSIQTASTVAYAISGGSGFSRIVNNGAITSAGGGITSFQASFNNVGTLTAAGTGVAISGNGLTNSGTIRSTSGIGVQLSGNVGTLSTNSGTIQGATTGAQTGAYLTNTGTITATGNGGTAVRLDAYGVLFNNAGGVIGNGGQAVSGNSFNESVVNAGTINGTVSLTSATPISNNVSQRYISQAGGVLNGNLVLGADGLLFTDLVNRGPGQFAGITGTVTAASGAQLRYRVTGPQSAALGPVGPFASATYELTDGAALTLAAPGVYTRQVALAGTGSVELNANLTTTTATAALAVTNILATQASYGTPTGSLAINSRGTIAITRATGSTSDSGAAVSLGGDDSFTNSGTISVTDRNANSFTTGITGGLYTSGIGIVTNAGSILLDGGIGIRAARVVNTGTIAQIAGGAAASGVAVGETLDNQGIIRVGGVAVTTSNSGAIVNAETISSTGGIAIAGSLGTFTKIANASGGTIAGTGGTAVSLSSGVFTNAGAVNGTVDLGYGFPYYAGAPTRSYGTGVYVAAGGTVTGDLLFGDAADLLLQTSDSLGVSGVVDGGAGIDIYGHVLTKSGSVAIDLAGVRNFEDALVQALGNDTVATATAAGRLAGNLYLAGNGSIVNQAVIGGTVTTALPYPTSYPFAQNSPFPADQTLVSITNAGSIAGGASVVTGSFTNTGTVGTIALATSALSIQQSSSLGFMNSGVIANNGRANTIDLRGSSVSFGNSGAITSDGIADAASLISYYAGKIAATNSGTITGGFEASSYNYFGSGSDTPTNAAVSLVNSGTITRTQGTAVDLYVQTGGIPGSVSLNNTGTIEAAGNSGIGALVNAADGGRASAQRIDVVNSGTISANGSAGVALLLNSNGPATATVVNSSGGLLEATGSAATAVLSYDARLDLSNAGTIRGSAGTLLAADNPFALYLGTSYVAGAIQTGGSADDRIVNTGTIIGSVALGEGSDTIENRGRIEGNVFLGAGDDTFLQLASATLVGTVDGGAGLDSLVVDATGGGAVNGDQFVNFERFSQVGQGTVAYSGNFRFGTIGVGGSTVTVAAGQTLTSTGPVTLTGTGAAETVTNSGTIAGSVALLGGNDRFVNNGSVGGAVSLGDGDDEFVEGAGSRVAGGVDGGAGSDLYTVVLAGDRTGLGARTGFERLGVTGTGTLSLTLDQSFDTVALTGTGLNVTLAGRSIGAVTGSAAAETLAVDGDIASVSLGAGDDTLALGTARAAGRYDGGAGTDTLRFTAAAPVTLAGAATGFEQLVLAGNALTVTGTLGSTGAALAFGAGDQQLTLANGGTLAGTIDLGAGNDSFRLAATGAVIGTVAGGAGTDVATIELAGNRTIGGELTGFETLATEGTGILSLTGTSAYDRVTAATDLTVVAGATLTVPQVQFGAANNRFTIAGGFVGSVDGGAGTDTIAVSGGSEAAPVAFGSVANVENFAMSGGFATVSGTAAFGSVDLSGGRLVGLAGSTIGGSFLVRQGATFGSAGTINGNLTIAGTLSPGASPGTMTVNGNVAIQSGSMSLFEITPTVSDKLVVDGAVSIASGAALQLVPSGSLRPGTSYDLIVATGGITGGYTTIVKPDTLFGFVVQRADRIQLLGQFLNDAAFSPQVTGSIAYANATLSTAPATSPLFAALPALLTTGGASNPTAFAQLTPEAYASASQIGVDNALALAGTARGAGFGADGEDAHAFTFAQTLGGWHRLDADPAVGTSTARSRSYGFVGGVGIGSAAWSIGGVAGYLNDRQQIDTLGARTKLDGVVVGVHGRYQALAGFGLTASILYDGGTARTNRALPGTAAASGRYDLHSWVGDVAIGYDMAVASGWTLRPRAGITYVRTTRDGVTETGGSPFALTVGRDRHVAGFADGGLSFARAETSAEPFRPFVSLGVRYQLDGTRTDAVAGYAGGRLGVGALGAARSRMVGTAAAGLGYRLPSGLDLFASAASQTGNDDHQQSITAGMRLRF